MLMRFKDSPDQSMVTPQNADKVMHAQFQIGDTTVMASDGRNTGAPNFQGFALSIIAPTEAEADGIFAALGEGGQVTCRSPRPSSRRVSACSPTGSV